MTNLLTNIQEISGLSAEMLWAAALVFLRVGAAMALLPAFGEQSVPQRLRLILTLAFTAVVAPAVAEDVQKSGVLLPAAIEVAAGLAIGAGLRLFIMALQIAGAIIAQATSLSQLFGANGPEPQPAIGQMFTMAALALAVMSGLHVRLAEVLILSYEFLPPGAFPTSADFAQWGLSQVVQAFSLGFTLAAPFTIAALIYNLAIGVINRAMPSLMVSFIGAPALSGCGLAVLALLSPLVLGVWLKAFGGFLANPFVASP